MAFYDRIHNTSDFVISFTKHPCFDFGVFARGYTQAANILAEHLLSQNHFSDYEAYPVVFLYRNAFELYLKHVIYQITVQSRFKGIGNVGSGLHITHRLDQLAKLVVKLARSAYPNNSGLHSVLAKVQRFAEEFTQIDPGSDSYRYPINTRGGYSTDQKQRVNLQAFSLGMADLLNDLEVLSFGVEIKTDQAMEVYKLLQSIEEMLREEPTVLDPGA